MFLLWYDLSGIAFPHRLVVLALLEPNRRNNSLHSRHKVLHGEMVQSGISSNPLLQSLVGSLVYQGNKVSASVEFQSLGTCNRIEVHALVNLRIRTVLRSFLQYISSVICIREVDEEDFVKTTGSENSGIDDIGSIGSGNDVDLFPRLHPIHLSQELIYQPATSRGLSI